MPPAPPRKIRFALALSAAALAGLLLGVFTGPKLLDFAARLRAPEPDRLLLVQLSFAQLPGWGADPLDGFAGAMQRSCKIFKAQKPGRSIGPKARFGTAQDWAAVCDQLAAFPKDSSGPQLRAFLEQNFTPLAVHNHDREMGTFTGYYEPELRGSLRRRAAYATPLLAAPPDLVSVNLGDFNPKWRGQRIAGRVADGKLHPLQPRSEIMAGALKGEKLELLYVDDPVDAFFLHIQGSGRVRLDDGRVVRLGYAGQNGHPYVAIGKTLVQSGALARENVSMQSIRAWLAAHPQERDTVMAANPSYVFFQVLEEQNPDLGPPGAQNVPLTPGRSLAVDPDFLALGMPVWLDAAAPDTAGAARPLQRLMVAQDTGGAIRGPVRGDVFWGFGPEAAAIAGRMNAQGRMYILVPRAVAARAIEENR